MFNMKCQLTSDKIRKVMISREVKVASYKEICGGEKIRVHLGYNNQFTMKKVTNNKLIQYPAKRQTRGEASQISNSWEVFDKFFSIHNIEPIWHDCEMSWGGYDAEVGGWTGCMGKV